MNKQLRVLMIEDSEDDAILLTRMLKRSGFSISPKRVETREQVAAALQREAWDIILCDYNLPTLNALDVLAIKQEQALSTPLIIVSGSIGEDGAIEALKQGASDFVLKQNLSRLVPAIERELREAEGRRKRSEAEEALRASEHSYRTLAESLPGIVYRLWLGEVHQMTFFNNAVEAMTGFAPGELAVGEVNAIDPLMLPEDRADAVGAIERAITANVPFQVEYRIRRKDGAIRYFSERGSPSLVTAGAAPSIDGVILDVTDQQIARQALERARQDWETIFHAIGHPTLILDKDHTILVANKAVERAVGLPAEQLVGRKCYEFFHDPQQQPDNCPVRKILALGLRETQEEEVDAIDRTFLASCTPICDETGAVTRIIHIATDITDRKRAEQEKARLQMQLLHAQKMEAIGTLAGGVAHDFNNALTTIQGFVDLAITDLKDDHPVVADLKQVRSAASHAAALTRQLLVFSRRSPADFAPVNLNDSVNAVLAMVRRVIGEHITITTECAPDLWMVQADADNIEQVLMNLILNARDAMPHGGSVSVTTYNREITEQEKGPEPDACPGRYVVLSVADTGMGMAPEVMERMFEPFFTTKEAGRGTGLGLSVVYGIIKQHNGWVRVSSTSGQGTTFMVFLPAVDGAAGARVAEQSDTSVLRGSGEEILLVEDDAGVLTLTSRILTTHGYKVTGVANAREALNIMADGGDRIDVLITDVRLADQKGTALAEQLREAHPRLRVLFTSGYSDAAIQEHTFPPGRAGFLRKPYAVRDLLAAVRELATAS